MTELEREIVDRLNNADLKKLISQTKIVVPWEQLVIERVIGVGSAG